MRNLSGHTVAWVFGLSMFSIKGEHIGWCEEGVFYDIHNNVLGFIPGATGLRLEPPALASEPALPAFSKRPHVPTLRGRGARPAGRGWSGVCLTSYLERPDLPAADARFIGHLSGPARPVTGELAR